MPGKLIDDADAEHFSHQPFGQVPWLTDGDISIFESGVMLLYLGERRDAAVFRRA
jgi:glutathione S-transferase